MQPLPQGEDNDAAEAPSRKGHDEQTSTEDDSTTIATVCTCACHTEANTFWSQHKSLGVSILSSGSAPETLSAGPMSSVGSYEGAVDGCTGTSFYVEDRSRPTWFSFIALTLGIVLLLLLQGSIECWLMPEHDKCR